MKKYFAFVLILSVLTASCSQKTKRSSTNDKVSDNDSVVTVEENYLGQDKMEEINTMLDDLELVRSLRWEKINDDGRSFTEVTAYINDDGVPVKITEEFSQGNFNDQGKRHFYLEDNKLVAFEENKDAWLDSNTFVYEETQTFYNENEPVATRKRTANSVEEIESSSWKTVRPESHTLTKVNKILSGSDEYETHFISIIEANSGLFLLLGEPKDKNRYQTAVRVDEENEFIKDLIANYEDYKYRPIEIQFVIEGGNGQPQFQVLTAAKWKDQE